MRTLVRSMLPFLLATVAGTGAAQAAPAYRPLATIALGAPDRWDYVVADSAGGRVYVAHSDRLAVIDSRTNVLIGNVDAIPGGTHGTAIAAATGQGFTDDGQAGKAVAFDLATLKIRTTIPADADADAMVADAATGHVFVINGDSGTITVIDPATDAAVTTIKTGGKLEYAAQDGVGSIYVAGAGNRELLKIDTRTNAVVAHWPTPDCASPHGLAYDGAAKRVFMGCVNALLMVIDATDGHIVAKLPIGNGSDAVAFDAKRKRVFSSNGRDGTVTIYQQAAPDRYEALEPLKTMLSARTMDVDSATGHLFIAGADTEPSATPGGRPKIVPGSLRVLVFEPAE